MTTAGERKYRDRVESEREAARRASVAQDKLLYGAAALMLLALLVMIVVNGLR